MLRAKRITSACILALLLLLFAGDVGYASTVTATAGGTVSYTVEMTGAQTLAGFKVFLDYDTEVFSLAQNGEGDFLIAQGAFGGSMQANVADGGCAVLWYNTRNLTLSGALFTVTLNVADEAESGDYPISVRVSAADTVDVSGHAVELQCNSGKIAVAAQNAALISVGSGTAVTGKTCVVPVLIENNPGFAGFGFQLEGLTDKLVLTAIACGSMLADVENGSLVSNVQNGGINWTNTENVAENGELLLLTFDIADDCEPGRYPLSLSLIGGLPSNFTDYDSLPVPLSFVAGGIQVNDYIPGDLDNDSENTSSDAVLLARQIVGLETLDSRALAAADVNRDGFVTAADCVKLARYLVGLIETLA